VTLPPNSQVLIDSTIPFTLGLITIPATSSLIIGENAAGIYLDAEGIEVTGSLIAGSETCRLESAVTITLYGERNSGIDNINPPPPSTKGISVTGELQLHGKRFYKTWSRLAQTAKPGDTHLLLQHEVNWKPGQEIILVTTAMRDSRDWHQNEVLTVESVGEGIPEQGVHSVVYLTSPVVEVHLANGGYQAEVGLLTRQIKIQGAEGDSEPTDPSSGGCTGGWIFGDRGRPCENKDLTGYGGHIMVREGGVGYVEGVELYRMGQTNVLGRYPMHFHVLGDDCPGCYFRDSSVWRSFYRCISIHGTNGVLVSENVAFDVIGYCYYLEDGVEENNTLSYNLAAHIHMIGTPATGSGQTVDLVYQSDSITLPADVTAAGYYITNLHNNLIGNAASGGWSGFAFPTLYSPVGVHASLPTRPANRLAKTLDGNTAHSSGWWWSHAGAFYFGGTLFYDNNGNTLVYNAGRDTSRPRYPCLVDQCATGDCNKWCSSENQAYNRMTNTKAYLVPSVGLNSWSGRMEIIGFEGHDVGLGLEALESGFYVTDMLVECRSGETLALPTGARADYMPGNGFTWYDTGQEHIIIDATFRNCGQREAYDDYDTSPTRGCDQNDSASGCHKDSYVFGFLTHSDQFTPEIMQATRGIHFEDCGRRFRMVDFKTNNQVPTVSGRNQNWLDVDGSVSGLSEPTLIGSGLPSAGLWWKVDDEVVHDPQGPLEFIKQNNGPERGLGHIRIEWDTAIHQTVGSSSCGNGNLLPCPSLGKIRHWGPMFDLSQDPLGGLPVTAQAEIVGPTGGYGWLLDLDGGSPKSLKIEQVEVDPDTPLMLAIAYPPESGFEIKAHAAYCSPGNSYSCKEDFKKVGSITDVRYSEGNTYYFDETKGLLYIRIVMPPQSFTGDTLYTSSPSWHLWDYSTPGKWGKWWAIDRFSRQDVTLPKFAYGPYLTIDVDCPANGAFCSQSPPNAKPDVCSVGYQQVAYDKCCSVSSPMICEFLPSNLAPTTSAPTPTPAPSDIPVIHTNLVYNPGFENGLDHWSPQGPTNLAFDTTDPRSGGFSVLVTNRLAGWHGVKQDVLPMIEPAGSTIYEMSCWVKLKNTSSANFKLTLQKTDDSGTSWRNINANVSDSAWTYVSGSITVNVVGSLTKAILFAEGPGSGVDFYLDDVTFVKQ